MKALKAWVARDKNGMLFMYLAKPIKFETAWMPASIGTKFIQLNEELFPKVKWEDEEPTELTFTIKKQYEK